MVAASSSPAARAGGVGERRRRALGRRSDRARLRPGSGRGQADWDRSADLQAEIVGQTKRALPHPPPDTTIYAVRHATEAAPGSPSSPRSGTWPARSRRHGTIPPSRPTPESPARRSPAGRRRWRPGTGTTSTALRPPATRGPSWSTSPPPGPSGSLTALPVVRSPPSSRRITHGSTRAPASPGCPGAAAVAADSGVRSSWLPTKWGPTTVGRGPGAKPGSGLRPPDGQAPRGDGRLLAKLAPPEGVTRDALSMEGPVPKSRRGDLIWRGMRAWRRLLGGQIDVGAYSRLRVRARLCARP